MKSFATTKAKSRLSYREATASPCATCATSPCCTYLPLHSFTVANLLDLDYAACLLNFDRIELGLYGSGEWYVYYRCPCRFLNRPDSSCTVHNTPEQPNICVHYNPYHCWYKLALTGNGSDDFLRIDQRRMEIILEQVVFDEQRNIVAAPSWETLAKEFVDLPILSPSEFGALPTAEGLASDASERLVLNRSNGHPTFGKIHSYSDETLLNPCNGCHAYCCTTLVFPKSAPTSNSGLDFFRYCLGFPDVDLGIFDEGWALIVNTTCLHLKNNLCSLFGKPDRPLICKYYDEWKCAYKPRFGTPRHDGFLKVRLEHFQCLAECFQFDDSGTITHLLTTEEIREHIEARWQESGVGPAARPALAGSPSS